MATLGAVAGASCSLALCGGNGTISASGLGTRSTIVMTRGAAAALCYTECQMERKLQSQRLHATAIIINPRRQSLKSRVPAGLSEEGEAGDVISAVAEEPELEDTTPKTKVTFTLRKEIHFGQIFNVAGSSTELGQWDLGAAIPLVWSEGHVWTADVAIPVGQTVEYKFVLTGKQGEVLWQPGENRLFETKDASDLVVSVPWDAAETNPEASEEVPAAVAEEAFGNGVAPGTDVVESVVTVAGMVGAKVEELAEDLLPKVSGSSDDSENGKPGGEEASELPAVDAIVATAVAEVREEADDPAGADI